MESVSLSCSSTSGPRPKPNQIEKNSHIKSCSFVANKRTGVLCASRSRFRSKHVVSARISCSYGAGGEVEIGDVSRRTDAVTKIRIPALVDEPSGNSGSQVKSCFWEWKPKFVVHYEVSGLENTSSPAILLLPGFGVGSFHYEKQLKDLGRQYRVYALDFLGLGKSLPMEDPTTSRSTGGDREGEQMWGFGEQAEPWAEELVYSADLWRDQVDNFVQQVIGEPVHIVGNSLGGYMALCVAACNPELVKGVTLLNATPFWGFLPNPETSPRLAKLFPWAGTFPLPPRVRSLTAFVWQKISEPETIYEVLKQVYADHSTKVDKVFNKIIDVTRHPAAPASFASIMFAPRAKISFREALIRCKMQEIPICFMYGKDDPWVKPVWGLRAKQTVPEAPLYEISPAGHCPHDEVPEVVNYVIRGWIENLESQGLVPLPLLEDCELSEHVVSGDLEYVKEGHRKSVRVNVMGSNFSLWSQVRSFVRSRISNARMVSV